MKTLSLNAFTFIIGILLSSCGRQANYYLTGLPAGFTPQEAGLPFADSLTLPPWKN